MRACGAERNTSSWEDAISPQQTQSRVRAAFAPNLDLPPPFRLITLREVGDAFQHAQRIAAEEGAGSLVWVGRFDLVEFAVVLEPDEALNVARRTFYAGMIALGDALAAHAPPEKSLEFRWPDAVHIDGALVGGGRLAWPANACEEARPDWLVIGAMIRTTSLNDSEPGLYPLSSALAEEGFDLDGGKLVESFARQLMLRIDAWQETGFASIARDYQSRLAPKGVHANIAENGDLLMQQFGGAKPHRHALASALDHPTWYDPQTRGPKR